MSQPPPKRIPVELNKSIGLTEYFSRLTDGLYFLWHEFTNGLIRLPEYTVSTLPDPVSNVRRQIYVSNESGGATIAFSDGVNWRRVQDRAIVS